MTTPLLSVRDLSVSFPSEAGIVRAVRSLSYDVHRGEALAIVGESGSGKSVSSLAVMGLLPGSARVSGEIHFDGENLLAMNDKQLSDLRGGRISMVFQDPLSALTPVYTVGQQIAEVVRIHHPEVSRAQANERAIELLEAVGIPNPARRAGQYPHEYSGGMRQRAMIAIAIANEPDLIIADEPTTALDVTIQAQVMELLKTAQEMTGAATILITHDLGVVAGFADRVLVMYAGEAVESGTAHEVFTRPRMPYTVGLLSSVPRADVAVKEPLISVKGSPPSLVALPDGCPFAPRCPIATTRCQREDPELLPAPQAAEDHLAACHHADQLAESLDIYPRPQIADPEVTLPREQREVALRTDGLLRTFPISKGVLVKRKLGEVRAVDEVDLEIRQGECLALVGESGSGKSTTILEVMQLQKPQSGTIEIGGLDTSSLNRKQRAAMRSEVAIVFQDPMASLDPRLPIGDILREPMRVQGYSAEKMDERVDWLLRTVGLLPEQASRYPTEFSGGQRQRVGIARALACEPKLIVLDEPVSALDVSIQAGVINLLDDLKNRLGLSYLFVSHDLSVVSHISDRIAVMYLGKIVEIGDTRAVFESPQHPYTKALLSAVPVPDPEVEKSRARIILAGDVPSPDNIPSGCRFAGRCPVYRDLLSEEQRTRCSSELPQLHGGAEAAHAAACHFTDIAAKL
ncbi:MULTISPECIES: ABC transporter ATP-binding protein [unclassified Brachybacterium]|uniref:ABC transporter ATP-binding protein n=1 Tax=unclassified Brachybacterium TaxID=2623841 RepID=UPI000C809126|nr:MULTISPECIES: ABC transporter ATP-binding protein [unclassified Brachybacterium]PMC75573.1 peptide ABC transporter ATP-binding protein [Brachybacterium sp. UMB0905]